MSICGILNGVEFSFEGGEEFVLKYEILCGPVTVKVLAVATAGRYIHMDAENGQQFTIPWDHLGTKAVRVTPPFTRAGKGEG